MSEADSAKVSTNANAPGEINNVLSHLKSLEESKLTLEKKLQAAEERIQNLSAEKRASMESALNTIIQNWVQAVETKDETVKSEFMAGCKNLVEKSDESNGVWQMMVAASNLHKTMAHDLDTLRTENNELKTRVDGIYSDSESRTTNKRSRSEPEVSDARNNIWDDFALNMQQF